MGTPGVPGAGIISFAIVLNQAGIPLEAMGIFLAIDPVIDMIITGCNVTGDVTGATVVAKVEKMLDQKIFDKV